MDGEFDAEKQWFDLGTLRDSGSTLKEQFEAALEIHGHNHEVGERDKKQHELKKWFEKCQKSGHFPPYEVKKSLLTLMNKAEGRIVTRQQELTAEKASKWSRKGRQQSASLEKLEKLRQRVRCVALCTGPNMWKKGGMLPQPEQQPGAQTGCAAKTDDVESGGGNQRTECEPTAPPGGLYPPLHDYTHTQTHSQTHMTQASLEPPPYPSNKNPFQQVEPTNPFQFQLPIFEITSGSLEGEMIDNKTYRKKQLEVKVTTTPGSASTNKAETKGGDADGFTTLEGIVSAKMSNVMKLLDGWKKGYVDEEMLGKGMITTLSTATTMGANPMLGEKMKREMQRILADIEKHQHERKRNERDEAGKEEEENELEELEERLQQVLPTTKKVSEISARRSPIKTRQQVKDSQAITELLASVKCGEENDGEKAEGGAYQLPVFHRQDTDGRVHTQYKPLSFTDVTALACQLPALTGGGAIWLHKFGALTSGILLSAGDISSILSRCCSSTQLMPLRAACPWLVADPSVPLTAAMLQTLREAIREHFPTPTVTYAELSYTPQPAESPSAFLARAEEDFVSKTGENPMQSPMAASLFRSAVIKGMPEPVKNSMVENPDLPTADHSRWCSHLKHHLQKYSDRAGSHEDKMEKLKNELLALQVQSAKQEASQSKKHKAVTQAPVQAEYVQTEPAPTTYTPYVPQPPWPGTGHTGWDFDPPQVQSHMQMYSGRSVYCNRNGRQMYAGRGYNNNNALRGSNGPPGGRGGMQQGGWNQDQGSVQCWSCGEYGHISTGCPRKRRQQGRGGYGPPPFHPQGPPPPGPPQHPQHPNQNLAPGGQYPQQ
ncbi:uncharacterized protein LOC131466123 [Solea solea]|uniref:uncharacterized protein LOC131466123 n=1 Tax=Solea solea TaxID=90069 RepID=UPI00272B28D8|nr:uncharacterized protein LOC131466123 [Solea solea]